MALTSGAHARDKHIHVTEADPRVTVERVVSNEIGVIILIRGRRRVDRVIIVIGVRSRVERVGRRSRLFLSFFFQKLIGPMVG